MNFLVNVTLTFTEIVYLYKSVIVFTHLQLLFTFIFVTAERLNDVSQIKKEHPNKVPVSYIYVYIVLDM